jgi:Spy/CpxP family protein refolding chaperone
MGGWGMGMGPAMMGGGYGPGPGMMGGGWGPGAYGMGPGMRGGYGGAFAGLNLSAEQRKQVADIQETTSKAMWQLMGTMRDQRYAMNGAADDAAARKAYDAMAATRQAMFELRLQARNKIDAVLTAEQRDQLRRGWGKVQ